MKPQLSLLLSSVFGVTALTAVAVAQGQPLISVEKDSQAVTTLLKGGGGGSAWSAVEDLDLTEEQQAQIEDIKARTSDQLAEILTPEQMEAFQSAQAGGGDMRRTMMGMGLERSQMSELRGVMSTAQNDIMAVLTPEQRAQLEGESPRDRN